MACSCSKSLIQIVQQYEAGYIQCQHCNCGHCKEERKALQLEKCERGSCGACKRIATGEKIHSWTEDFRGEINF